MLMLEKQWPHKLEKGQIKHKGNTTKERIKIKSESEDIENETKNPKAGSLRRSVKLINL